MSYHFKKKIKRDSLEETINYNFRKNANRKEDKQE